MYAKNKLKSAIFYLMDDSKRYFLDILKKTNESIEKLPAELNSLEWYYQLYLMDITTSVREGLATETIDKLLKRLTRFYIDNEAACEILANSYQDIRREYFLYKKRRIKEKIT